MLLTIHAIFLCFLDCLCFFIGFTTCFSYNIKENIVKLACSFFAFTLIDYFITNLWEAESIIIELSVSIALLGFCLNLFGLKNLFMKITLFLQFFCISNLSMLLTYVLSECLFRYFPITNDFITGYLFQSMCIILFYLFAKQVKKAYLKMSKESIISFMKLLLVPTLATYIIQELYFEKMENTWILVLLCFSVLTFLIIYKMGLQLIMVEKLQHKNKLYKSMLHQTKKTFTLMNKTDASIRKMKHDFDNHLIVLKSLIEEKELDKAKQYIKQVDANIHDHRQAMNTENKYLNIILNQKLNDYTDINFTFDIHVVQNTFMEVSAFCSLLFNLLDNAIEEVSKLPLQSKNIILHIHDNGKMLKIHIRNPLGQAKTLVSEKDDSTNHGLGLEIVREIVERYNGEMTISQGDEFIVKLVMFANYDE